jgi:hypothetical protein
MLPSSGPTEGYDHRDFVNSHQQEEFVYLWSSLCGHATCMQSFGRCWSRRVVSSKSSLCRPCARYVHTSQQSFPKSAKRGMRLFRSQAHFRVSFQTPRVMFAPVVTARGACSSIRVCVTPSPYSHCFYMLKYAVLPCGSKAEVANAVASTVRWSTEPRGTTSFGSP